MRYSTMIFAGLVAAPGLVFLAAPECAASAIGLQVDVAGSFLAGADLAQLEDAPSIEVLGSMLLPSSFEVGVGTNMSSHDIEHSAAGNADITNVFGEVRYRFNRSMMTAPHLHPFLAGRAGYSRLSADGTPAGADRNGFLIGGGGGVEYWFTNQVAAVGSAMMHYVGYGSDGTAASENLSGTMTDIQLGMKVRF